MILLKYKHDVKELKTSEKWQKLYPEIKVLDPDGWNRENFQYSWFEEKINIEEYNKRLITSTVIRKLNV